MEQENIIEIAKYKIKFENLSKGEHEIDLNLLGISLQGFAKTLKTAGQLSVKQLKIEDKNTAKINVTTDAKVLPGSIEICVYVKMVLAALQESAGAIENVKTLFNGMCSLFYSKREKTDMDAFKDILLKVEQNRHIEIGEALDIANKALELTGVNCANSVSPIGKECQKISIYKETKQENNTDVQNIAEIDINVKNAISAKTDKKEEKTKYENILLCALDKTKKSCKFYLKTNYEAHKIKGDITLNVFRGEIIDPDFESQNNAYAKSFYEETYIRVFLKKVTKDKKEKYYLMDCQDETSEELDLDNE